MKACRADLVVDEALLGSSGGCNVAWIEGFCVTVRMLIHELHVTIINADTGEIVRDLTLDPTRDYQDHPKVAPDTAAD